MLTLNDYVAIQLESDKKLFAPSWPNYINENDKSINFGLVPFVSYDPDINGEFYYQNQEYTSIWFIEKIGFAFGTSSRNCNYDRVYWYAKSFIDKEQCYDFFIKANNGLIFDPETLTTSKIITTSVLMYGNGIFHLKDEYDAR